jgi:hypothetical protein
VTNPPSPPPHTHISQPKRVKQGTKETLIPFMMKQDASSGPLKGIPPDNSSWEVLIHEFEDEFTPLGRKAVMNPHPNTDDVLRIPVQPGDPPTITEGMTVLPVPLLVFLLATESGNKNLANVYRGLLLTNVVRGSVPSYHCT